MVSFSFVRFCFVSLNIISPLKGMQSIPFKVVKSSVHLVTVVFRNSQFTNSSQIELMSLYSVIYYFVVVVRWNLYAILELSNENFNLNLTVCE